MITIKFSDHIEQQYNSFKEILKLDNYNDIIYIWCVNNSLSILPELPNSLEIFWCVNNSLSILPELPNSLIELYCCANKLSSLPKLPNSLEILWCSSNNLSSLPELPNLLDDFVYYDNPIYTFIKKNLKNTKKKFVNKIENWFLDCKHNSDYSYCRTRLKKEYEKQTYAANIIRNWYLDCKYNPKYLYCRKRVMKEYEELYSIE